MKFLAVMRGGTLQQTDKEIDQENMEALDEGHIDHIIKFDETGFSRAIVTIEGEEYVVTWEKVEII